MTIISVAPDMSPLPLSFPEAAEPGECPHVLLQFLSCWVTLASRVMCLGRGCASPILQPALHSLPWGHQTWVSAPSWKSPQGFSLLKLPKESVIRLGWKEIDKIQSVMKPSELCCFSGSGGALVELGWWLG